MKRAAPLLASLVALAALAPAPARAAIEGIELLGFGAEGTSLAYSSAARVPLRFRLRGTADGEPVNVILRRDDGATTVLADVREAGSVLSVDVPLKDRDWTLNEYEAFALVPGSGAIHESPVKRTLIRVGVRASTRGLAGTLERARDRLASQGLPDSPPGLYEPPPSRTGDPGFEGELLAGFDLDLHAGALD